VAEESQAAGKALLAALATGFVHAALDARHGFAHFPHTCKGGAILATGKTKTTLVNRGFARFGCHGYPLVLLIPVAFGVRGSILTALTAFVPPTVSDIFFQGNKLKACK
jgi:hypothetical protein